MSAREYWEKARTDAQRAVDVATSALSGYDDETPLESLGERGDTSIDHDLKVEGVFGAAVARQVLIGAITPVVGELVISLLRSAHTSPHFYE